MLVAKNRQVACEPFPAAKVKNSDKLAVVRHNLTLVPLKVVVGCRDGDMYVNDGETVYVKGTAASSTWAREVMTSEGLVKCDLQGNKTPVEFVLVPTSEIVFVDKLEPTYGKMD